MLDTLDLAPGAVCETLAEQASDFKNPPITRDELLERLEHIGPVHSVARMRAIFRL